MNGPAKPSVVVTLLLLLFSYQAHADWNTISYANEQRFEMITGMYDGKVYILNGFDRNVDIVNSVEVYNPDNNSWNVIKTTEVGLENAVTHAGYTVIGSDLWIFGGRIGDSPGKVGSKVWIYSMEHNTWTEGPELPNPFAGGGAAVVDNKIHVFGGLDEKANCDVEVHYVYDLSTSDGWVDITNSSPFPMPRNRFSTIVFDNKIYAMGGQNSHGGCPGVTTAEVDHAHVYDPATDDWTRLSDLPFNRSHAEPGTFVYGDQIFIVGGQTNGSKVLTYTPATDKWTVESDLELDVPIMAPTANVIDDELYVIMGSEFYNKNASSKTRVLELPVDYIVQVEEEEEDDFVHTIPTPTEPQSWTDSYSVNGQCYCDSTFDHQIGEILYSTPLGEKPVRQICADISTALGEGLEAGRVYYNTIQCGHDPVNLDKIYDEWTCPGIAAGRGNYTGYRCEETGATWNLDHVYSILSGEEDDTTEQQNDYSEDQNDSSEEQDDTQHDSSDSTVLYRVNAGGAAVNDSNGDWEADNNGGEYVNTGKSWSTKKSVDTALVPGIPSTVFTTERWDHAIGAKMKWSFPVQSGQYEVNLYFAEIWNGAMKAGKRVFDVKVEDEELKSLDVYAEAGGFTGLKKTFIVNSDNSLNIELTRVVQNPAIKAIEIIKLGTDQSDAESDNNISDTDNNTDNTNEESDSSDTSSEDESDNSSDNNDTQQHEDESETDDEDNQETDNQETDNQETDDESDSAGSSIVYRINAGGPSIADDPMDWESDKDGSSYVNTGKSWTTRKGVDTSNLSSNVPESLFTSERWDHKSGEDLQWALPVTPGEYQVNLYFAEIWSGAMATGKRVFDVSVEDQELKAVDVFDEVGGFTSLIKTFVIDADSEINISLQHLTQNPTIKGIEVIKL